MRIRPPLGHGSRENSVLAVQEQESEYASAQAQKDLSIYDLIRGYFV